MRYGRGGPQFIEPPEGALEDFAQIIHVSEIRPPVSLGWVYAFKHEYEFLGLLAYRAAAVAQPAVADLPPLVICSTRGVRMTGRPLVLFGSTKDEAEVTARRFLLGHEVGHLRQFERGDFPGSCDKKHRRKDREKEAHQWSCEVFRRLGWDVDSAEYLVRRWPQRGR